MLLEIPLYKVFCWKSANLAGLSPLTKHLLGVFVDLHQSVDVLVLSSLEN
jgi:hypothetical protein